METGVDDIDTAGGDDIVMDLLSVPLSRRPFNEKMDIVENGRQTPKHLELNQPAKAGFVSHFQASNWESTWWVEVFFFFWEKKKKKKKKKSKRFNCCMITFSFSFTSPI